MSILIPTRELDGHKPAKRYQFPSLTVTARTIGTKIDFKMPVINLSSTGMLLSWAEKERVPFTVATILELKVSPESGLANAESSCLAKIIHTSQLPDGRRNFGVKIIQAEDEDIQHWQSILRQLEEKSGFAQV